MMMGPMSPRFDPRKWEREARAVQRKAEAAMKREMAKAEREMKRGVDRVNRENKRRIDAHNRNVEQQHKRDIADYNRRVDAHNRKADAHNQRVIADINRRLRAAETGPRYTQSELALADDLRLAIPAHDDREWDIFLSYARIDGAEVAGELRDHLDALGTRVWFDELTIEPGRSQSRQMDVGLQKARAGVVLLTPAYVAGRFWTERELGALLAKNTLIPVLHNVTFDEVREYSGILPDLAGFETERDTVEVIAQKIAAAVLGDEGSPVSSAA
jgi:TIR domain